MGKIILGIIVIVCMQFVFITYMALQTPVDIAAGPVYLTTYASTTADINWADDLINSAVTAPKFEETGIRATIRSSRATQNENFSTSKIRSIGQEREASPKIEAARLKGRFAAKTPQPEALRLVEFRDIVIRYNGPSEEVVIPAYVPVKNTASDLPKATKRSSFIRKAMPIVRKPWDWVRALTSKFD